MHVAHEQLILSPALDIPCGEPFEQPRAKLLRLIVGGWSVHCPAQDPTFQLEHRRGKEGRNKLRNCHLAGNLRQIAIGIRILPIGIRPQQGSGRQFAGQYFSVHATTPVFGQSAQATRSRRRTPPWSKSLAPFRAIQGRRRFAIDAKWAPTARPAPMTNPDLSSPSGAIFSDCDRYRYALWRRWSEGSSFANFVGLNPSTADATHNDPTIRRCIRFARDWGHDGVIVTNLFAWRATYPTDLRRAKRPIGPDNDAWIKWAVGHSSQTVAAWGNDGLWSDRRESVLPLLSSPLCLGQTKLGAPRHPLYVRADRTAELYLPEAA